MILVVRIDDPKALLHMAPTLEKAQSMCSLELSNYKFLTASIEDYNDLRTGKKLFGEWSGDTYTTENSIYNYTLEDCNNRKQGLLYTIETIYKNKQNRRSDTPSNEEINTYINNLKNFTFSGTFPTTKTPGELIEESFTYINPLQIA